MSAKKRLGDELRGHRIRREAVECVEQEHVQEEGFQWLIKGSGFTHEVSDRIFSFWFSSLVMNGFFFTMELHVRVWPQTNG